MVYAVVEDEELAGEWSHESKATGPHFFPPAQLTKSHRRELVRSKNSRRSRVRYIPSSKKRHHQVHTQYIRRECTDADLVS